MLLALAFVVAAQAEVIDSWNVPVWGDHVPGDSGFRVLPLKSRVDLWSIACEQAPIPDPETGEAAPYQCFPAKLRLPASAQPMSGDFLHAREEMARLRRCFDVHVKKAPDSVVAQAITQDMEPALAAVKQNDARTPTLVVVAWAYMDGWQRQFDFFSASPTQDVGGEAFMPLAIPSVHPTDELTVAIVKAPGAQGVVEAIRAGKYRTALTRAKAALALEKRLADDTKSALRANVSAAAILAGQKRDVIADDGFNDVAADAANGTLVQLARRWAKGEVWLGPDPCR